MPFCFSAAMYFLPYTRNKLTMRDALQTPARSQLSDFSDAERSLALEHFQMLQPFLEDQMPLANPA